MDDNENSEGQKNHLQPIKKNKFLDFLVKSVREFLAVFCWGYAITKLFIFDVDVFFIEKYFPNHAWLINYGSPVINGKSRKDVLASEEKGDLRCTTTNCSIDCSAYKISMW